MSDKSEGWGGGAGDEDAAPKDMAFLPEYAGLRRKGMLSHIPPHFPFSLLDAEREKEKLSGFVPSLSAGTPRSRARRKRETRLRFPAPKPSALANEKRHCPIRFVGRRRGCPDSGAECDGRGSENTKGAKIASMMFKFFGSLIQLKQI